jgi:hypothetical protein
MISCSKYQSFEKTEQAEKVLKHKRWEFLLPYKSGKDVTIDLSQSAELLIYESSGDFHVVRIPLDNKGEPGKMSYTKLNEGEDIHRIGTGQLLVEAEKDDHAFVALLDPKTLDLIFSKTLPYSTSSINTETDRSISFGHWRQKGDILIFYHNHIKIKRYSWSNGAYNYSVPYVADFRYDIHLINLTTLKVRSFVNLTPSMLGPLGILLEDGKSEIISNCQQRYFLDDSQKVPLDQYIYSFGKFFLVDDQQVLIFSLENEKRKSLYFLLDLRKPNPVPTWDLPDSIVAQFPDELVLTEADKAERMKSQDFVVKDRDLSDVTYDLDQINFSPGGFVLVGRKKYAEDVYADERSIVGVQILSDGLMSQTWRYVVNHRYHLGPLLFDPLKQRVFFPETDPEDRFKVVGCMTSNGEKVSVFPANILLDRSISSKGGPTLRIVGTAVDFEQGVIYIHDQKQHRILSADIDLSH